MSQVGVVGVVVVVVDHIATIGIIVDINSKVHSSVLSTRTTLSMLLLLFLVLVFGLALILGLLSLDMG